ncbi:MmcB family DNA repair protein [Azospirillum sp. B21]|uniref:MmcB family DNA repair protein n=1 Tax=Azospirillum sp. B21 TaxID=2607496 RepID=UPI0011EE78F9|nr:MmcB family DNA repair protein [Azospirillum sp. B21]KAA0577289.1 MmcB family DNA repair protein [Azospirillum sp. B21]
MSDDLAVPASDGETSLSAGGAVPIFRGVRRALATRGYATLTEFRLASGRRADVLAIDESGCILIVEVKSGVPDFRSDQKWQEYREWCDAFYFAVDDGFPTELIPEDCGLMVADAYGAEILREAPVSKLAAARRKTLLLRAAMTGAGRLHRIEDPMFTQASPTV